jgi:hypothetical protein
LKDKSFTKSKIAILRALTPRERAFKVNLVAKDTAGRISNKKEWDADLQAKREAEYEEIILSQGDQVLASLGGGTEAFEVRYEITWDMHGESLRMTFEQVLKTTPEVEYFSLRGRPLSATDFLPVIEFFKAKRFLRHFTWQSLRKERQGQNYPCLANAIYPSSSRRMGTRPTYRVSGTLAIRPGPLPPSTASTRLCTSSPTTLVYGCRDPNPYPFFPSWDKAFIDAYNKINDGEWQCVTGQPCKRVIEHFGYADLAMIDDRQAASMHFWDQCWKNAILGHILNGSDMGYCSGSR